MKGMIIAVVFAVSAAGCGGTYNVNVKHSIDFKALETAFSALCTKELTEQLEPGEELDGYAVYMCTQIKLAEYLETIKDVLDRIPD